MDIMGDKVVLRDVLAQDEEMLQTLIEDPEIIRVTGGYARSASCGHPIKQYFSAFHPIRGLYQVTTYHIIADHADPRSGLGIIVLSNADLKEKTAKLYIKLIKSARRKGYGRDAVNCLASHALSEWKLNHIYASILEQNTASRKLFEACGFQLEDLRKSSIHRDGREQKVCLYGRGG